MAPITQSLMPMGQSVRQPLPLSDALAPLAQPGMPPPGAGLPPMAPPPAPVAPEPPPLPPDVIPLDNGIVSRIQPDGRQNPNAGSEGISWFHISDAPKMPKEQPGAMQQPQGTPLAMQAPQP